jgi:hypothetical protein
LPYSVGTQWLASILLKGNVTFIAKKKVEDHWPREYCLIG